MYFNAVFYHTAIFENEMTRPMASNTATASARSASFTTSICSPSSSYWMESSKMRKKKSRGKKLWESLSLLGHKWMNNVSALSTNTRCTTNWNSVKGKSQTPTHQFYEISWVRPHGHNHQETLWNANEARTKIFKIKTENSTHPRGLWRNIQFDWCK